MDAHRVDLVRDLFYASARSLQIGQAVEVIAITSVAANLSAILGGILVFGEPIGSGAVGIISRLLLRIGSASITGGPARDVSARRDPLGDFADRDVPLTVRKANRLRRPRGQR